MDTVLGGSEGAVPEAVSPLNLQVSAGPAAVSDAGESPCGPCNGLIIAVSPASNHLFLL